MNICLNFYNLKMYYFDNCKIYSSKFDGNILNCKYWNKVKVIEY